MSIKLLENEKLDFKIKKDDFVMTPEQINEKYEKGFNRIVTEQGSFKLSNMRSVFGESNYVLHPEYQRRLVWSNEKKSKLIESFIMNVPVPPIFLYEAEYDEYEIMDGLQRISSIIAFYNNEFKLEGLEEWPELNGYKYDDLPKKIKEGIDRRQLQSITLLKESTKDKDKVIDIKKTVFERLNTGGEKLEPQEIRNALYDGPLNKLCIELSTNENFKKLWNINDENLELYNRMEDVELVLRFFAIRQVDNFKNSINKFLDDYLKYGNEIFDENILAKFKHIFEDVMGISIKLFGKKAFCQFKNNKWSRPQRASYDPLCLAIYDNMDNLKNIENINVKNNINLLKKMYEQNLQYFNSKNQSKNDIIRRSTLIDEILKKILKNEV